MLYVKEISIGNADMDISSMSSCFTKQLWDFTKLYGTSLEHDRFDLPSASSYLKIAKSVRQQKCSSYPPLRHGAVLWKERQGSLHERKEVQEITDHQ